jgi:hypothetical protein
MFSKSSCPEQHSRPIVCSAVQEGVAAVFGPRAPNSMGIVQSVCETLEIPNVRIYPEISNMHNYPDMPEYQRRCHINLYPAQESVAQVGYTARSQSYGSMRRTYFSCCARTRPQEVLDGCPISWLHVVTRRSRCAAQY